MFDQWCRLLVQDMRDDAMYGNGGETVVRVVVEALQNVRPLVYRPPPLLILDGMVNRLPTSTLTPRTMRPIASGLCLAFSSELSSFAALSLRSSSAFKLTSSSESTPTAWRTLSQSLTRSRRRKKRRRGTRPFRFSRRWRTSFSGSRVKVLSKCMLVGHRLPHTYDTDLMFVSSRSKNALDTLIEKSQLDVPVTSKVWEPLRAYQKRLITSMGKDPCELRASNDLRAAS